FLKEAEAAFTDGDYATCVRRSQETVEMSLKGVLRMLGLEYPTRHDVGDALAELSDRTDLPEWFRSAVPQMTRASRILAEKRGPAFYGDETAGTPPSALFEIKDGEEALSTARRVQSMCRRIVESEETNS
ncbi:MAG: HEPN domain-containing protein, partial [Candidatus Bathyarchaeia archaeon]